MMYLPHPNFAVSALVMTDSALLESLDEARNLQGEMQDGTAPPGPWDNHVLALMLYSDCLVRELVRRGVPTEWAPLLERWNGEILVPSTFRMPAWLGDVQMHRDHRRVMHQTMAIQEIDLGLHADYLSSDPLRGAAEGEDGVSDGTGAAEKGEDAMSEERPSGPDSAALGAREDLGDEEPHAHGV